MTTDYPRLSRYWMRIFGRDRVLAHHYRRALYRLKQRRAAKGAG